MSNLHNLLQWWNLLFALPLVVGMLFSLVTTLGFVATEHAEAGHDADASHGEGDHEVGEGAEHGDFDHGADVHAEHGDFEHGIGAYADHASTEAAHGEVAHDAHAGHAHGAIGGNHHDSVLTQILEAFGIGRGVPISVMLPFCMMLWGVLGLASNQALHPLLHFPAIYVWVSVLLSLLGTLLIARGVSGVAARYLQIGQAPNISRERLIGAAGVAVFPIDAQRGVADVHDPVGTVHRITCRIREGNSPLPTGTPVVVTDYEFETGSYVVEENPFADSITHREVQG